MTNYSKADTRTQWFQDDFPGSPLNLSPETMVLILHTTEGRTWPGYSGGGSAPNYTHMPGLYGRAPAWRAHFPDERSSRALRNESGGVQTNTLNCVQLELIGTCDPKHARSWNGQGVRMAGRDYVFWPAASEAQLREVALFLADMHERHGLKLVAPKPFKAYPSSYGANGVRMSFAEWRSAAGVFGHQHVPENSHGDPGNIPIARLLTLAGGTASPTKEDEVSAAEVWNHMLPDRGAALLGKPDAESTAAWQLIWSRLDSLKAVQGIIALNARVAQLEEAAGVEHPEADAEELAELLLPSLLAALSAEKLVAAITEARNDYVLVPKEG